MRIRTVDREPNLLQPAVWRERLCRMNYKIVGDSCCDYTAFDDGMPWLRRVPLFIDLEDKHYIDNDSLDIDELLREMAASPEAPKSACPSPGAFLDAFEGEETEVYVVTLSGKLSGSYASAVNAARMAETAGKQIHVFDSRSAAAGEIAICLKLRELKEQGLSFEETVVRTERYIDSMHTLFVLETLETFRKSGRLTHLQAVVTAALKLKLIMKGEPDGSIGIAGKALTIRAALVRLAEKIRDLSADGDFRGRRLVITHCNCPERAEYLKNEIMKRCRFSACVICRSSGISTIYANDGGVIVSF